MTIPPRHAILVFGALLVLGGCHSPSEDEQLDTVRSWTATVRLAVADRRRGAINGAVTTQLRDRAHTALGDARQSLRSGQPAVDSLAAALPALDALVPRP